MTAERDIQHAIRLALGRSPHVVLWRNTVGVGEVEGRKQRFGLCKGSSDLVGMMRKSGRFVALEIKTDRGRLRKEQTAFLEFVRSCGGHSAVVRSVEDAEAAVESFLAKDGDEDALNRLDRISDRMARARAYLTEIDP